MSKYKVIKPWRIVYTNPIELKKGEGVHIDETKVEDNPDWQGWVWCKTANNEGWAPEQALQVTRKSDRLSEAVVKEDYSAREIDADTDEIVIGDKILYGWLWCHVEGKSDQGWLPVDQLLKLDET